MRHSLHLICAAGALAVSITLLIHGCGGNDLTVGGPLPIVSITAIGVPTPTPTCVSRGGICDPATDNCCTGLNCLNLTLTCG